MLDNYTLAQKLLELLVAQTPERLQNRYKIDNIQADETKLLERIGKSRGYFKTGGHIDTTKAAESILTDFRHGRLGKFTLDSPPLT